MSGQTAVSPRVVVTGFGPFPNAPENPTEALVRALLSEPPDGFGAGALRAIILPTDYRRSWATLTALYRRFPPDIVVHFGLSRRSDCLKIERGASRAVDPSRCDVAGFAPSSGRARRSGADWLAATLPVERIVAALSDAGFPAAASDDAGRYVCNATLYRSLVTAPPDRVVGFVHVPPLGVNGMTCERLKDAARLILQTACRA